MHCTSHERNFSEKQFKAMNGTSLDFSKKNRNMWRNERINETGLRLPKMAKCEKVNI